MEEIQKIVKVKNVNLENVHTGCVYKTQDILKVIYKDGKESIIDLDGEKDITNINYMKVIYPSKIKEKIIFSDFRSQ